jgi:dihydrofolate reductase
MPILSYTALVSLDGYHADAEGRFDWAAPDEQVHAFVNDLVRPVVTYLYGRRMYDVMAYWETVPVTSEQPDVGADFARIWQAADKVVYSRTLAEPVTAHTRIERAFDADAVRRLKAGAAGDLSVGGPALAASAIRAGLVDEVNLFVAPVVVGAGDHFLPGGIRLDLELLDERRFRSGFVYLRYRILG